VRRETLVTCKEVLCSFLRGIFSGGGRERVFGANPLGLQGGGSIKGGAFPPHGGGTLLPGGGDLKLPVFGGRISPSIPRRRERTNISYFWDAYMQLRE